MKRLNTEVGRVFSAHAEVVPMLISGRLHPVSILRARGGSSIPPNLIPAAHGYSPRTRR